MSNQKQIALSLIMFHDDNDCKYPWQVSTTNGISAGVVASNQVFPYYRALSDYCGKYGQIFVCPTDPSKQAATDASRVTDTNISYFLSLDAGTNSASILGGDRHLESVGKNVGPGWFTYSTNMALGWTRELHGKVRNGPIGFLSFADGHVQATRVRELNLLFQNQLLAADHLGIP